MQNLETDILIVGTGLAGLSLAKYLSEQNSNLQITLLSKTSIDECNTYYAQGGIAVVHDFIKDSYQQHIQDTLLAGKGICDKKVVEHVITEAPARLQELIQWGVELDKNNSGELDLGLEGGHSQNRIVHHKDKTGLEIETKLIQVVQNLPNVTIKTSFFATDLLLDNQKCIGIIGFDEKSEVTSIVAKATVLATGGSGQVFGVTSNPFVSTGDGVAMAYRAGAKLDKMKYIQFHPTALYEPNKSQAFLITEAIRGFGAHILNQKMERFVFQYHPDGELATRDIVSKAISDQMKKEHSQHVWLDVRHLPIETFKTKFPKVYNYCFENGIDVSKDLIPITPAAHYQCGGIVVDEMGATSIKQLFAIGECSHTGLHGANRLASNSLLEGLVFSARIASDIAATMAEIAEPVANNSTEILLDPEVRHRIQVSMSRGAGVLRSSDSLVETSSDLTRIGDRTSSSPCVEAWETTNLFQLAQAILKAALIRQETRGSHWRADFPETSDLWRKRIIQKLDQSGNWHTEYQEVK